MLRIAELGTVIADDDAKGQPFGKFRQRFADMTTADDNQSRRKRQRLNKDFDSTTTDSRIARVDVVERVVDDSRLTIGERGLRFLDNLRFHRAAADCPDNLAS